MTALQERQVVADGFTIRYAEAGEGPTLVCFHGAGGLRLSRAHELLATSHRVVAFEAPGFGESPVNDRSASMRDLAATMREAIRALGIDRAGVWGTSFGGKLALWLAVDDPAVVEALVLASPAAIREERAPPAALPALLFAHPERQPPAPPLASDWERSEHGRPEGAPAPSPAMGAGRSPAGDAGVAEKQQALASRLIGPARDPELEEAMRHLEVPTLVLFGSEDRLTPPELGRRYRELLPSCQFVIVYDAAHALDADRPEAFAAIVTEFLARREQFVVRRDSGLLYP